MDAHEEPRKPDAGGGSEPDKPSDGAGAASGGGAGFDPERPSAGSAVRGSNAPVAVAEVRPFSPAELNGACMRPYWIIEYVLANKKRLMKNIEDDQRLALLAALLFLSGILFAIPYGVVRPTGSFWKIATLYTGSLLICFPSLYVFNQYYGSRLKLRQSLAVSLIISSVAAMFSLGFAPIIWFIDFTTKPTATTEITPHRLSVFLLAVSFSLGVFHMLRCVTSERRPARIELDHVLLALWVCLLAFITYRMGSALELLPW